MSAVAAPLPPPPGDPQAAAPQTRTLLITDMVDSTGTVERLGDRAAADLFRGHDRLVLELQRRWRGRLIDRSDGLLLLFERAIDGLGFALDYQRGLHDMGKARGLDLKARAGIHVGEVLTWHNEAEAVEVGAKPLEVEGLAKPMAGRLLGIARPGQILLSGTAESLARRATTELGDRGGQLLWKSHGRWRLKGVENPIDVWEAGEPGFAPLRRPIPDGKSRRDVPKWRQPLALAAQLFLVASLGLLTWFFTRPQPAIAFSERDWVVVADMRNLTGQPVLDDSLQQAFRISLEQSRHVNVLSDLKARDTLARMQRGATTALDREVASEIALRDGARAVILPTVAEVGGRVRVSAEVIDPHSQTTVYSEFADGDGLDSVLASVDDVTAALRARLGEEVKAIQRDSEPLPQVTTSNLDALRAYALGQQAFQENRYADAQALFERAVEVDPGFALAHVAILRTHSAQGDRMAGLPALRRAQGLRSSLPLKDALYLDAWAAEVDAPSKALGKWQHLASLYPDYFPAVANVGWSLFYRNRFGEALPYAKRSSLPQNELSTLGLELHGRILLAQGKHEAAAKVLDQALEAGATLSALPRANVHATRFDHGRAESVWKAHAPYPVALTNRVSLLLDRGQWAAARQEADRLLETSKPGQRRFARIPVATLAWLAGDRATTVREIDRATEEAFDALAAPGRSADKATDAYLAAFAGILAQRAGEPGRAREVLARLSAQEGALDMPYVADLVRVVRARDLMSKGDARGAVALLEAGVNGHERFELHVALLEAYLALDQKEAALREARWLGGHRGWAYTQLGCGLCQQPMNVMDSNLARLRAADILLGLGREEEAAVQMGLLERSWSAASLPAYLRERRDAVGTASKGLGL
ncbi:putative peptide modification system cyclase [Luteimonas pelagia]